MSAARTEVALSLVAHTNVGKTTLARTLLRRDVGSVFDQAHVTEVSDAFLLVEDEHGRLVLWDTPGIGDTARLVRRLRKQDGPVGWFLGQVWDRLTDRSLYCSQQALRNVREQADLVLYLVNGAEDPEDAGYPELELELLAWFGKPVLVVLNQTGDGGDAQELAERWRRFVADREGVRGVLVLDAFRVCWVEEDAWLRAVAEALDGEARATVERLRPTWNARQLQVFEDSVAAVVDLVGLAVSDCEPLPGVGLAGEQRRRAMTALASRLEQRAREVMARLVAAHGLSGEAAGTITERVEHFVVGGATPFGVKTGALWGGLVSGAATGLAADVAAGGLSFGGGAVVGAILGVMGGAGLAKGFELGAADDAPGVRWGGAFRGELLRTSLLRYLAVAQYGRGRGDFVGGEESAGVAWVAAVDAALTRRARQVEAALGTSAKERSAAELLWRGALRSTGQAVKGLFGAGRAAAPATDDAAEARLEPQREAELTALVDGLLRDVFVARFPGSAGLLER